jgi:arylsulfatase A-like enzyme
VRQKVVARRAKHLALLLTLCALLLAGGAALRRLRPTPDRSILTPNTPAVLPLRQAVRQTNVLIVVIDAARADHLRCYGYPRDTTPNIDRLASESVVFTNHFCQMPFTTPSTASLFTGQFPDTHGIIDPALHYRKPEFTMAKAFGRAGFRTALFSSTPCASPAMGVGTSFGKAYYKLKDTADSSSFSPEALLPPLRRWLSENRGHRFLAYVHFVPPHWPYEQPPEMTELFSGQQPPGFTREAYTPQQFDLPIVDRTRTREPLPLPEWINLYDANLRYADWAVGEVISILRGQDLLESTLLIVTADHGEAFGEHGFIWHTHAIHDEVGHIPLVVRFPRNQVPSRTINCLTQTIDLLPTLCDLFEIPCPPDQVQGCSLLPVLSGLADTAAEYTVLKSRRPEKYLIRDERYALLLYPNPEWRALYDLADDPGQRRNVIDGNRDQVERLLGLFREYAQDQRRPPHAFLAEGAQEEPEHEPDLSRLPADVRKQLKALGYLE